MKSLLLLIILMFQAFILHAQTETIDGFELGGSRITAIEPLVKNRDTNIKIQAPMIMV